MGGALLPPPTERSEVAISGVQTGAPHKGGIGEIGGNQVNNKMADLLGTFFECVIIWELGGSRYDKNDVTRCAHIFCYREPHSENSIFVVFF